MRNWTPTCHRASVGKREGSLLYAIGNGLAIDMDCFLFEKIVSFIGNLGTKKRLLFLGLIGGILKSQGVPSRPLDSVPKKLKAMRFNSKLLTPAHGVDLDSDFADEDYAPEDVPKSAPKASKKSIPKSTGKSTSTVDADIIEKQRSCLKAQLVSLDKMMKHISLQRQIVQGMLEALPSFGEDVPSPVQNEESSAKSPGGSAFMSAHAGTKEVDESIHIDDVDAGVHANADVQMDAQIEHTVEVGELGH